MTGLTDHPKAYEATADRSGVAYADLEGGVPDWLRAALQTVQADAVLVTPHWGPNMLAAPLPRIRRAAAELLEAGATLVAGHSAHVFHGVERGALYDLGDFVDDYATHPVLRNDLGLLFLVTLEPSGPVRVEALPLKLDYCYNATSRRCRRGLDPPSFRRCPRAAGLGGARSCRAPGRRLGVRARERRLSRDLLVRRVLRRRRWPRPTRRRRRS